MQAYLIVDMSKIYLYLFLFARDILKKISENRVLPASDPNWTHIRHCRIFPRVSSKVVRHWESYPQVPEPGHIYIIEKGVITGQAGWGTQGERLRRGKGH